jgi:hypothetical protein
MSIQYAGGTRVQTTFSGQVKTDLLTNIRANLLTAGWSSVVGAAPCTFTVTIGASAVVTMGSGAAPADGTRIVFSTTGALPTGLTAGTVYFVKTPSGSTFNVAASSGGAAITTSGSQSGVQTVNFELLMQTATTPQGCNLRARIRDNGSGVSAIGISIESSDGVKVGANDGSSHGGVLTPASGKIWHICANQYQFALWVDGDYNSSNEFCLVSCPYLFSFLAGITYYGFLISSNNGAGCNGDWRYSVNNAGVSNNNISAYQVLYNQNLVDQVYGAIGPYYTGPPTLLIAYSPYVSLVSGGLVWRYGNGDAMTLDPLLCWGLTGYGDESMVRGQLWDAVIVTDQFLGDYTCTFDTHNWIALTSSQTSGTRFTLFLATS